MLFQLLLLLLFPFSVTMYVVRKIQASFTEGERKDKPIGEMKFRIFLCISLTHGCLVISAELGDHQNSEHAPVSPSPNDEVSGTAGLTSTTVETCGT